MIRPEASPARQAASPSSRRAARFLLACLVFQAGPACSRPKVTEAADTPKDPSAAALRLPKIQVLTFHPGMPTSAMETTITNRIERQVSQTEGVRRIESHTITGVSIVRVEFHKDMDLALAVSQVGAQVQSVVPTLPRGTSPPLLSPLHAGSSQPLGVVVCSNPALDGARLTDLARTVLHSGLAKVEGCAALTALGGSDRAVVVRLDPQKLDAHGITAPEVLEALRKELVMPAGGTVAMGDNQASIEIGHALDRIERLNDTALHAGPAQPVFLRDVGQVEDTLAEPTARVRVNGHAAVCLPVLGRAGSRPDGLRKRVAEALPGIEQRLPAGTSLSFLPFGDDGNDGRPGDTGLVTISLRGPSGMTLDASERLVAKAERLLESSIPAGERLAIVSELGVSADAWAALTQNCGPQDSTVRVQLSAKRSLSAQEYAGKLRRLFEKELPGARTRFEADGTGPPVEIRIEGGSLAAAAELAAKVRDRVAHVRGTADVDVVQRLDARVLSLDIDRAKAAALGLSTQDVVGQTRAAWGADLAEGTLRFDLPSGAAYPLIVKYHQEPAGALDALLRMPVAVPNQHVRVPLATVVAVRQQTGPVEVDHIALQRVMSVRAAISGRAPDEVAAEIRQTLKEQPLPAGMFIEIEVNRPTPER